MIVERKENRVMRSMFNRAFDLNEFNGRVHRFMARHQGKRPNVMMVSPEDYECIKASLNSECLRFAYRDFDFEEGIDFEEAPFCCDMKIQDVKVIINRDCKEPILALMEGM